MNWILCLTKNNLNLTRNAVKTFLAQRIGNVKVLLIDDDSTDGTLNWAWGKEGVTAIPRFEHSGVAAMWNLGLGLIFPNEDYALVCNNDVELRPDTYGWLVADGGGFVTAVGSNDREKIKPAIYEAGLPGHPKMLTRYPDPVADPRPHPDFSCFLIRKTAYDKVGAFDENFKVAFCEDWDYHVRLHQAGIDAHCIDLPFLHLSSQTVRNSSPEERERIYAQARKNREYFREKWGVEGGTDEYYALFKSPEIKSK